MPDKPNILIFMTDQQQGFTVDIGHPCKTPRADAFAREGIRFNRGYTPTALCAPARASMMTSLTPFRHGMINNPHVPQAVRRSLKGDFPMFSHRLREAGYDLFYTGKWHVEEGAGPGAFGWRTDDPETEAKLWGKHPCWNKEVKADTCFLERPGYPPYALFSTIMGGKELFSEYRFSRNGIRRLDELASGTRPWCLYIGTHGPHDPYVAPIEYLRRYDLSKIPLPASYGDSLEDKPAVYRRLRREVWGGATREQATAAIAHYWAYISMIDDCFGEVLDALEKTGQAENTLVVFASDHGDMMGGHGLFMKGVPAFEECYRIPLLMRHPARVRPGVICDEFATLMDLGPTFIDIAQGRPLQEVNGRSLTPLFAGSAPPDWPREFYGMFLGTELLYSQRIVTNKKWKYVFNGFDFDELYDLEKDPGEMRNLYHSAEHRTILEEMTGLMWKRAKREKDEPTLGSYPTVALPPVGPAGR